MLAAAETGVKEACEALLSDSRDEVPYDQGDLSRSGKVTVVTEGRTVTGAVSYDTPYAVRQHEDTTLRHDTGKAGYLGDPLRANVSRYLGHVADSIKRALE